MKKQKTPPPQRGGTEKQKARALAVATVLAVADPAELETWLRDGETRPLRSRSRVG